jgi:hypothetical protein
MMRMSFAISHIVEWQGINFTALQPMEVWLALAVAGGFATSLRLPLPRLLMVLLLLYEALAHRRNVELVGMVVPLLVAAPLARQLRPAKPEYAEFGGVFGQRRAVSGWLCALALATVVALGSAATAVALDYRGLQPPGAAAPAAAVAAARAAGLTGNVFNSYRFGGYLMLGGIPVFIDGRADLYGDDFIKRYANTSLGIGDGFPTLLQQYAIRWAIFEPDTPTETIFDHLPGWRRVYGDKQAVVFRRTATQAAAPDRRQ